MARTSSIGHVVHAHARIAHFQRDVRAGRDAFMPAREGLVEVDVPASMQGLTQRPGGTGDTIGGAFRQAFDGGASGAEASWHLA